SIYPYCIKYVAGNNKNDELEYCLVNKIRECNLYRHPYNKPVFNRLFNSLWDIMFKYNKIDKDKYFKTIEEYAKKVEEKIQKKSIKLNFKDFVKIFEQEVKIKDILDYCEGGRIEFEIIKNTQITQKETDILLDTCEKTSKTYLDKLQKCYLHHDECMMSILQNINSKINCEMFTNKGLYHKLFNDKNFIEEVKPSLDAKSEIFNDLNN
ncbi:34974_t:CDS:2, partial [Gigaspora margarita]